MEPLPELERAISQLSQRHGHNNAPMDLALEAENRKLEEAEGRIIDQDTEDLTRRISNKELERDLEKNAEDAPVPGSSLSNADTLADHDPFVVKYGADDPANPMNWPMSRKWKNMGIISFITLITPLASSMFAPAIPEVMRDFNNHSTTLSSFIVSVYLLGFAVGPIFIAPLSELYGRRWVYIVCNYVFTAFTVACGRSTSIGMLIAFRLLAGAAGCAPLTLGGGSIADMIPFEQRGKFMAIYGMGPLMGPIIGPIAGGYLGDSKGWRWIFYVLAIALAAVSIVSHIFLDETHHPTLLRHEARRLNKQKNTTKYRSMYHSDLPAKEVFMRAIWRPVKMLLFSPIILLLSLYMSVVYGYLYLLFTTFYLVFQGQYGFSTGSVGLAYLGIGVGSFLGLIIFGGLNDKVYVKLRDKHGVDKPEYRLPMLTWSCWLIPVGLFIYGWTAEKHVHWIAPILGTSLVGIGLLASFMPIQTYLVDAFSFYAASAIGANTILRSTVGALLPLAGVPMYDALGLGPGNSLLGGIAVAMMPIPFLFEKYGERIRERFKVNFD
ncbi:hypothetical protein Dda_5404 [Drechslerella dactyloides]|uniref:Major facilitator superfamily (MFS) profile domain-containing protein n=1 Tax=Drechslerella dactyloides TaxID=74499 RepID=A0AAD6NIN6_DREDA|nr:hypothetical protein Dda_5404 [Drechslerella dactyloides]